MKIPGIRVIYAVLMLIALIFCCTGCSDAADKKKETAYATFLVQKITDTSDAVKGIKNQMDGFSEEQLSDETWISQTTSYLSQINSNLDQIIQYDNIPSTVNTLHQSIISVCETGKNLTSQFETGIANQNLSIIRQVSSGLNQLIDQMNTVIQQIKGTTDDGQ